jgi:prevent-host-death family protein
MDTVNLYDAKTHLSKLVERAAGGEEIVIAKAGRPLARLVPLAKRRAPREFGFLVGDVVVGAGFDDPLPDDVQKAFDGLMP